MLVVLQYVYGPLKIFRTLNQLHNCLNGDLWVLQNATISSSINSSSNIHHWARSSWLSQQRICLDLFGKLGPERSSCLKDMGQ